MPTNSVISNQSQLRKVSTTTAAAAQSIPTTTAQAQIISIRIRLREVRVELTTWYSSYTYGCAKFSSWRPIILICK